MADIKSSRPERILRWAQVKERTGISRSAWDRGVRAGVYPAPFRLGPPPTRAVGWREADINRLVERLAAAHQEGAQ